MFVNVDNVIEPPRFVTPLLLANSAMPIGTLLGNVVVSVEPGLTLQPTLAIVEGNEQGLFQINPVNGALTLLLPNSLPNPELPRMIGNSSMKT